MVCCVQKTIMFSPKTIMIWAFARFSISKLRDTAYAHYSLLVEQVLKDQITDEQQLEQIMDGLCDFCDEIRFIDLYRSLCRHIYYQYPQLVGEHVALFRALFEGPDEK